MVKRIWSFFASFVGERRAWRSEMDTQIIESKREIERIQKHRRQNFIEAEMIRRREGARHDH